MAPSSTPLGPIRELFLSDVTRDIPPVVYFHEQSPEKLKDEVGEYIITGGWPKDHPNHRRVPDGIHEQYVKLLRAIATELDKKGGTDLPNVWISGFYGSGKSSFAKLLGLALDGKALPDGRSVAEAWLARDTSPRAHELREAWSTLRAKIEPLAVVFDIGGVARDAEHIHSVAVRQLQSRLGYSSKSAQVAFGELELERADKWETFTALCQETYGKPWDELRDEPQAQARFSNLMARLYPDVFTSERDWHMRHSGVATHVLSPEEAIGAIRDMLDVRRPRATVFFVVDEVSQYVLSSDDRVERLRAFASALGSGLKGRAWLLALGQQKVEAESADSFLVKTKDRFPPQLRVHLAATNIRDVVHKRLLQKRPEVEASLKELFERHRADLKLYAYDCEEITAESFVETYPMLPGHIDLLLQITTALRSRSERAQGDDQAIRGLLQLLGELFRGQKLADKPVGSLITLDQIYEVQHTALESHTLSAMARIHNQCANDATGLQVQVAKAVALLELISETVPTDAKLVAQCLYDRLDRGNRVKAITEALEELRRVNLIGYSEKHGYKIQSPAGEEWERDRREISLPRDTLSTMVQDTLKYLLASPERPRLHGRPFPWAGVFSDGRMADDVTLVDPRDEAVVRVDFRFVIQAERTESTWVKRSTESQLHDRLVWVGGPHEEVEHLCRELHRSRKMVDHYDPKRASLSGPRKMLLQQEKIRVEDLEVKLREAISDCFMAGRLYFRGREIQPQDHGTTFAVALSSAGNRVLPDLFPHFLATAISPGELVQLLAADLNGASPKFLPTELGILENDSGRLVPSCSGVVPGRILERIETEQGIGGTTLIAIFGGPPYGYPSNVVKACVAGLLRAGKVRILPDSGGEITAVRDAGSKDLFEKDRVFRRASFFPTGDDDIGFQARARICKFFESALDVHLDREDHAIADAVSTHFPSLARRLREVVARFDRLPGVRELPAELSQLQEVLERCVAQSRQTKPTVQLVKKHLSALRGGVAMLKVYDSELTASAVEQVRTAGEVLDNHAAQLLALDKTDGVDQHIEAVSSQVSAERPWRHIGGVGEAVAAIVERYARERQALLVWQEQLAEQARGRVKRREGFSTLTADQSHHVLRPFTQALTDTTPQAIAPGLSALREPFVGRLARAEELANERLDELLSDTDVIVKVDLKLRNRVIKEERDVDAMLSEIRARLLEQLATGAKVRLV
ncbi:MAG: BREX system P-loop protein BrxC [Deltaproteobacteria bacterium]|nr:MAG: BREX system P-loop protein BrxC [Deltaproteobacteria bacterium]